MKRALLMIPFFACFLISCLAQNEPASNNASSNNATSNYATSNYATSNVVTKGAVAPGESMPAEYVVGSADVLDISVWKEPGLSQSFLSVRPDGMISMPLIGVVKVSGLTPSQIQDLLAEKLRRFLSVAQVTVTVSEIKSKFVYITGEVNKPGAYPLVSPTDVLQLIIKAGGLTTFARSRSIVILRASDGKQQKLPVNYKKLLHGEYLEQNIALLPGDTVVVP